MATLARSPFVAPLNSPAGVAPSEFGGAAPPPPPQSRRPLQPPQAPPQPGGDALGALAGFQDRLSAPAAVAADPAEQGREALRKALLERLLPGGALGGL